jgi:hypothetical protein
MQRHHPQQHRQIQPLGDHQETHHIQPLKHTSFSYVLCGISVTVAVTYTEYFCFTPHQIPTTPLEDIHQPVASTLWVISECVTHPNYEQLLGIADWLLHCAPCPPITLFSARSTHHYQLVKS